MAAPASFTEDPTRIMHIIVLSIFAFLAVLAVVFRLWARKIQRNIWELSDYLIIVGLVWALGLTIFTMHSNIYWDLGGNVTQYGNPQAIQRLVILQVKAILVGEITWAVSVFFIRASILALYIRIFRTKSFRVACYVIHGINAAFFVSIVLAACLICRPISFNWDHQIPGGKCGDQKSLDLYIGIFNLLMDVTVVALPMPVLWGLQMALSRKVVISGMFGLGIIICIITLIRIKITSENHGANAHSIYSLIALFTGLEAFLGVINACLPVMKPIFTKFGTSKASSWLSSVMSGSIPVFIRPSQMGSTWKSSPSRNSTKKNSTSKHPLPKEMTHWPGSKENSAIYAAQSPPAPRFVYNKAANMMFASPTYNPIRNPPLSSLRPPVPPKSKCYTASPKKTPKRWEPATDEEGAVPGMYVPRDWDGDLERGESEDTDRQVLVKDTNGR